jgi:hypothetical protein
VEFTALNVVSSVDKAFFSARHQDVFAEYRCLRELGLRDDLVSFPLRSINPATKSELPDPGVWIRCVDQERKYIRH